MGELNLDFFFLTKYQMEPLNDISSDVYCFRYYSDKIIVRYVHIGIWCDSKKKILIALEREIEIV